MMIFYTILAAIGYLLVGVLWGYIRWSRYVDEELAYYEFERQRYLNLHRIRGVDIPEYLVFEWRNYVKQNERLRDVPPKASDFRGEIVFDVLVWPLAMLLSVIYFVYTTLMRQLVSGYNKGTTKKITQIRKDLKG